MISARSLLVLLLAAALVAACTKTEEKVTDTAATVVADGTAAPPAAIPKPRECRPDACPGCTCPSSITFATSSVFPLAACPFEGESQSDVDIFSWNEFIALNWPADKTNCSPTQAKSIVDVKSNDGTTVVWQTYMPAGKVFIKPIPGARPAPWCKGNALADGQPAFDDVAKANPQFAELGHEFALISEPDKDVEEAGGGVLVDQSGRWVRYQKLMNQTEYNYIVNNGLWAVPGQQAWANAKKQVSLDINSVEIKSAWKVLTAKEITDAKYFTTQATVFNTPDGQKSPGANPVTMGLVGLHIIQKTQDQQSWFWSTFEHIDNDQTFSNPSYMPPPAPNTPPPTPYVELDPAGKPLMAPIQAQRVHKVSPDPAVINAYYQSLLGNSVFRHYRLISTQWQTGGAKQGTPPWVDNLVLETYVQTLESPDKRTGCLYCHTATTPTAVKGLTGDFSFLFFEAKNYP